MLQPGDEAALVAELRAAKEAIETTNRAKSAFLATMNHKLRTPLTAIISFTGLGRRPLPHRRELFIHLLAGAIFEGALDLAIHDDAQRRQFIEEGKEGGLRQDQQE